MIIDIKNIKWANRAHTAIDCLVKSSKFDNYLPYTTTQTDKDPFNVEVFERINKGEFGFIAEYIETKIVPKQITPLQAKTVLLNHNLLGTVSTYIENLNGVDGKKTQLAWEFASSFDRDNPLIASISSALNLTSEQIDDLFIEASKL